MDRIRARHQEPYPLEAVGDGGPAMAVFGEEDPVPAHVVFANAVWRDLTRRHDHDADRGLMLPVRIVDMAQCTESVRGTGFSAWTNSSRKICVSARDCSSLTWEGLLEHELEHVKQFRKAGSRPANFVVMIRYECDAYNSSVRWAQRRRQQLTDEEDIAEVRDLELDFTKTSALLCGEISAAKEAHLSHDALDQRYRKFLEARKLLPKDISLRKLYGY